jgi:hypothetical protein
MGRRCAGIALRRRGTVLASVQETTMSGDKPRPDEIDQRYGLEPVFEPGEGSDGLEPFVELPCPYCSELLTLALDLSAGEQSYVEDCQVCCQPMVVTVALDEQGRLREVTALRGDD